MSDSSPLRGAVAKPLVTKHGARTELRLVEAGALGARYEVRWFLGSESEENTAADAAAPSAFGLAVVAPSGEVEIELQGGQVPTWALSFTDKLLRTTARSVQDGRYPRRLTRWRDAPD
jgi:hypothetical protein